MEENKYYVYLHIKETTGEPFYVGKGIDTKKHRQKRYKQITSRSSAWTRISNKYGFDIIFLEIDLSEADAFKQEKYWINRIGRRDLGLGPLVNHTDGGEGISGRKHTQETKDKISLAKKGIRCSEETKNKISIANKGMKVSQEKREQISKTLTGIKHTEERKLNQSLAHKGKPSSRKGIKMTEEQKKKISDTKKGSIPWNKGLTK